jgi:ubiquitin-protein ligase
MQSAVEALIQTWQKNNATAASSSDGKPQDQKVTNGVISHKYLFADNADEFAFQAKQKNLLAAQLKEDAEMITLLQSLNKSVDENLTKDQVRSLNNLFAFYLRSATVAELHVRYQIFSEIVQIVLTLSSKVTESTFRGLVLGKGVDETFDLRDLLTNLLKQVESAYAECVENDKADEAENLQNIKQSIQNLQSKIADLLKLSQSDEKYNGDEKEESAEMKLKKYLQSKQVEFLDLGKEPFKWSGENMLKASDVVDKKRLLRIKKELTILQTSLPDGIYVRVNEDRMDIMKVLILGPEGTPYQNGFFTFDLYLPPDWPNSPPKMNGNLYTGQNGFRFNANLYSDGYVCFSLLGTWEGPGWNAETSTLLQLLVSLQAMILCEEPYGNEPGWEGMEQSGEAKSYNHYIRHATVVYALNALLSENHRIPEYFRDVMDAELLLKKSVVEAQLQTWLEMHENVLSGNGGFVLSECYGGELSVEESMQTAVKQVLEYLGKIKSPLQ